MTMPTSISLEDATSPTPVAHVYSPVQDGSIAVLVNTAGATTVAGQETLQVEVNRARTDAAQNTSRVVLWDPKEVTVNGVTGVGYGLSGACTFKFPPGSTLQDKKDIVKKMANALQNSDIVTAVTESKPFI